MRTSREARLTKETARIVCTAGARPNFMKVAPILEQLRRSSSLEGVLVHTGQHYDTTMSDAFFKDLGLPEPDAHLEVGSETPARQTGLIMERLEPVLKSLEPACVLVVGDVNSTLASALTAAKMFIPVAHVEAGLRSRDDTMPEELNRILTDACSDLLLTTSRDADENLRAEGIDAGKIHMVGNVMIDTLMRFTDRARGSGILERLGVAEKEFALVTLHRPSNVDAAGDLAKVVKILEETAGRIPVVFPVHPRTTARLEAKGLGERLARIDRLHMLGPEGYIDFLRLLSSARIVLTDSGGIQEETTVLGVPCLTLRPNTERPITITEGTNRLIGSDPDRVLKAVDEELAAPATGVKKIPELWDGGAASRIVKILEERYAR